jgi:hypothetical protein
VWDDLVCCETFCRGWTTTDDGKIATDTVEFKPNTTYCGAWQFDGGYRDTYFCTKSVNDDYIITKFYTETMYRISHSKLIGSVLALRVISKNQIAFLLKSQNDQSSIANK